MSVSSYRKVMKLYLRTILSIEIIHQAPKHPNVSEINVLLGLPSIIRW